MKRLLQFGVILMMIGAFYPLLEMFDSWDASGLSNDTEFAVYAVLLAVCLVLLLCKLISSGALRFGFVSWQVLPADKRVTPGEPGHTFVFAIPPLFVPPLRI